LHATTPAVWYRPERRPSRGAIAGLLVSLVLVAAAALAPANAFAAAPPGFVGLQSWNSPTSAQLDALRRANVKVYRAQLNWARVEPTKGQGYQWDHYDRLFAEAGRQGITILPVLLGSPAWAASKQPYPPTSSSNRRAFYKFAETAAFRYRPNSGFWKQRGINGAAVGAKSWQVWNEPNLGNYWNKRPNAAEYARMVRGTDQAIKRANPGATTILAGLPYSKYAVAPADFLRGMFRADPKIYTAFGSAAVHPYARTASYAIDYGVRPFRAALNRLLPRGVYRNLWVTEIGWATGKPDGRFQVSQSTQARYLEEFYKKLLAIKKSHRINGAIWFSLADYDDQSWWAERTGLITRNGTNKPSWFRLKCVTGAPTSTRC
jgi:hypothetical protein